MSKKDFSVGPGVMRDGTPVVVMRTGASELIFTLEQAEAVAAGVLQARNEAFDKAVTHVIEKHVVTGTVKK